MQQALSPDGTTNFPESNGSRHETERKTPEFSSESFILMTWTACTSALPQAPQDRLLPFSSWRKIIARSLYDRQTRPFDGTTNFYRSRQRYRKTERKARKNSAANPTPVPWPVFLCARPRTEGRLPLSSSAMCSRGSFFFLCVCLRSLASAVHIHVL